MESKNQIKPRTILDAFDEIKEAVELLIHIKKEIRTMAEKLEEIVEEIKKD